MRITWNDAGKRYFEAGVDQGVFYKSNGYGVVWNGLAAVTETPSGGEARPYYIDGIKYLNSPAPEEYGGTIEAFTYPDEFSEYDGSLELYDGFSINLQPRKPFGLSYRTGLGNDLAGVNYGYKLHIIYNVLASPASRVYSSRGSTIDPLNMAWTFTTTPVPAGPNIRRTAHVVIDSTKVSAGILRSLEDYLYGTPGRAAQLIALSDLILWFENGGQPLEIRPNLTSGLADIIADDSYDLVHKDVEGLFVKPASGSRLTETSRPGLYILE